MEDKLRLHVGGLGSTVQVSDLEKTFTSPQLGSVQSVEIIHTKGRSFAYLEFVPASEKGLSKLFSTYNGCMWKGGRLKLEKAKEDYICRLKREWLEDAQSETKFPGQNLVDAGESVCELLKPKNDQDTEKLQLKIFFPKLRKLKAIPLKGTGKHKYSFQRIEVPPLPVHFCDCEEHYVPPEPAKRNHSGLPAAKRNNANDHEVDNHGVNEEELNMMKSVLDKLLEKEIVSEIVYSKAEPSEEIQHEASVADKLEVDGSQEDQVSDEDDFVINIVGQPSKRVASFENWRQKTSIPNQDSLVSKLEPLSDANPKTQGTKKANHIFDKKRKQAVREDNSNDKIAPKKKGRKVEFHDSTDNQAVINDKAVAKESKSVRLSRDVAGSNKSKWKSLVSEKGNTAFNISDILTNHNSDTETLPVSDLATEPCSSENVGKQGETNKHEEMEKVPDVQPTKPAASEDLLARGASWKQKSSWLQLVGDATATAFNISQVLPDITFPKQELQQFNHIDFSNSRKGNQRIDEKSFVDDIGQPQAPADKDIYANPRNSNEDALTKEQNKGTLVGEQLNSYTNEKEKVENESSAPVLGTNLLPNNRAMGEIVISETCPFMKSAASMKEWAKSKAALSGSHKKKMKEKESLQD